MSYRESVELLKKVYQNAKTGTEAIAAMMDKTHSDSFKTVLSEQKEKYYEIANEANILLGGYRELPSDSGIFARFGMWTSLQMNTVYANRAEKMAEVMINGSTEGMIDIMKTLNISRNADERAAALARRLVAAEQENIRIMQRYL